MKRRLPSPETMSGRDRVHGENPESPHGDPPYTRSHGARAPQDLFDPGETTVTRAEYRHLHGVAA